MKRLSSLFFLRSLSFIILLALLLILLASVPTPVHAIGFGNPPQEREFIFKPGFTKDVDVTVMNSDRIEVTLERPDDAIEHPETLGTSDDDNILRYVTLEDPLPNGSARSVRMHIALPEQMRPGVYYVFFVAREVQVSQGMASAVASVRMRFTFRVLSPEKRIDILRVDAPSVPETTNANVTVTVVSRTTKTINSIYADMKVYNKDGQVVAFGRSAAQSLPSESVIALLAPIETKDLPGGDYDINGTVYFDEYANDTWTEVLKIGTLHVALRDYTQNLTFNSTNQFLFNVSNLWNRPLQDVYAEVQLGTQHKKSASQLIQPFSQTQYEVYFDRDETIPPGPVLATITVNYKDYNTAAKVYVAKQDVFPVTLLVVAPPVIEKKWWEQEMIVYIMAAGFVLLLLIIVLLIVILLRSNRKRQSPSSTDLSANETPSPSSLQKPSQKPPSS